MLPLHRPLGSFSALGEFTGHYPGLISPAIPANMQEKLDWSDLTVLLAFGRTGTVADAASELGMDETTAARRLKRLETALSTSLVTRAGGKLQLTPAGKLAIERARVMEDAALELVLDQKGRSPQLEGQVRVTSLTYVLSQIIVPALPRLLALYPGLTLQMQAENRNLSLVDGETDIAVRMAAPKDTASAAFKLGDLAFAAYRPRNRFHGVPIKRCPWVGPASEHADIPEFRWLTDNIPADRIVIRSNVKNCDVAAVKAGVACSILPVLMGDNDRDMVRMDIGVLLTREIWLHHRHGIEADSSIGVCVAWLNRVFHDIAPQLTV
jgi:DNA-binding transcriptional LysR family regulator